MSCANGRFPITIADLSYDQVVLTTNQTGFNRISSNNESGMKYNYNTQVLKVGGVDANNVNIVEGKQYKPFGDYVRAFWEMSDKDNMMYDYSGNGFNLTNKGAIWSAQGVYFSTNEDVKSIGSYQEDIRRIELTGSKLNELFSGLDKYYSISFDFTPLESNSALFHLRTSGDTHLQARIDASSKLLVEAARNGVVLFSKTSTSSISLGVPHHFCLNSRIGGTDIYIDNTVFITDTKNFDVNDNTYESFTIGCQKQKGNIRYNIPYAGWIKNFMITTGELSSGDRNKIYGDDYGYDIIMLAGQSNMFGIAKIQEGIDNDYSEIAGKVFQYDFESDGIIAATNQLKHYQPGGIVNTMGGWLEFIKRYVKYYKKSVNRKVLLIPCSYPGSTFATNWNPEGDMMLHLIENTNKCTGYSKLNNIVGMLWYQGEGEVGTSNANFASDLETFRAGLIENINGFTEKTPMILTLINNKSVVTTTINGIPANQFVNGTMVSFATKYGYGIVKTEDLKLLTDWIHMTAASLRVIGKRWFDEFCRITGVVNKDIPAIHSDVKVDFEEANVDKLNVRQLSIVHDSSCDVDIESYVPLRATVNVTTPINIRVHKAMYQPKTDDIWLLPNALSEKTIKYWNTKTKKLVERTDWPSLTFSGYACCMYKDMLYVLDNNHDDAAANGSILTDNVLYIINTLNYTIETVKNFVTKTSNIDGSWTPPSGSSSNVDQTVVSAITYCSLFGYGDKIYFIPMAQQDVGIFDLKTRTFNQTTLALGYVGGFYGSVYNPTNKCLYFSRAYKVGSSAGWNIPYLNFTTGSPVLGSVTLPSEFVAYRYGCFCFSNSCVYIPMSTHNNGDDAILLKIKPNNTAVGLTLSDFTKSKQFNSILYSPDNRILLCQASGTVSRVKPDPIGDTESIESSMTITGGRFIQCFDKNGIMYSFNNTTANTFSTTRVLVTMDNKEVFNPIFNCLH